MLKPQTWHRLEVTLAFLAVGFVYLIVSARLQVGPPGLLLGLEVLLLIPLWITHLTNRPRLTRLLGVALTMLLTLAVTASAVLLIYRLLNGRPAAIELLRDAVLIWLVNVVVFAIWYWEIDGGGPQVRHSGPYASDDFIFPQVSVREERWADWQPRFVDYLFLAFNTSTAFSPTDTMVLSRRAKLLLMAQSLISLVVVVVLAARAINTL